MDLMGIGLGGQRSDTVAEEGTAVIKDQPKDTGDVRSAPASTVKPGSKPPFLECLLHCASFVFGNTCFNCPSSAFSLSTAKRPVVYHRQVAGKR